MTRVRTGLRVRRLREARGWAQAELARRANLGQAHISLLESGARRNPTADTLQRLAKALGVPIETLLAPEPPQRKRRTATLRRTKEGDR